MNSAGTFSEALFLELARELPAAPRLLAELGRTLRLPTTGAAEVVSLLRRDPALVSRVLQVANSSYYAPAEQLAAIEDAVLAIGFDEVHRVVGALAAGQFSDQPLPRHGVSSARLRGNALFVATLMEALGGRARLDPGACYTIGLLRSVGALVLERAADRTGAVILPFGETTGLSVAEWQRQHWGVDGWTLTARLLHAWQLPPEFIVALEHHENPEGSSERVVHVLQLATALTERDGYGLPGERTRLDDATIAAAGLTLTQVEAATERAEETFKRLRASVA